MTRVRNGVYAALEGRNGSPPLIRSRPKRPEHPLSIYVPELGGALQWWSAAPGEGSWYVDPHQRVWHVQFGNAWRIMLGNTSMFTGSPMSRLGVPWKPTDFFHGWMRDQALKTEERAE